MTSLQTKGVFLVWQIRNSLLLLALVMTRRLAKQLCSKRFIGGSLHRECFSVSEQQRRNDKKTICHGWKPGKVIRPLLKKLTRSEPLGKVNHSCFLGLNAFWGKKGPYHVYEKTRTGLGHLTPGKARLRSGSECRSSLEELDKKHELMIPRPDSMFLGEVDTTHLVMHAGDTFSTVYSLRPDLLALILSVRWSSTLKSNVD